MKFSHLSLLVICFLIFSCTADEELFAEALEENAAEQTENGNEESEEDEDSDDPDPGNDDDVTGGDGGPGENPDPDGDLEINSTPCAFGLDTLEPNGTLELDCQINLGGQTVNIPSGVTLLFNGGEIINGRLEFNGGQIDGKLLNQTLEVTGNVQLTSDVFQLYPERWDLVQGQVSSDRAQTNNFVLEGLMFYVKDLGATTFLIDHFDAFFEVSNVTSTTTNQNWYPTLEAVNVPGDFTLQMTDNTVLRVQPTNGNNAASLIAVDRASNVTVRGGNLVGDRDIRTYVGGENSEEGAHLFTIRSGKNVLIEGVNFVTGTSGGLNVNSYGFSFNPDYDPTTGVTVRGCVFEKNRMMSIAITDARNMIIENNTFIDSSQPSTNSDGGVVGYAINMEPVRTRDPNTGELILYQIVKDVVIRNNTERNSRQGAVTIYIGDNILIDGNDFESKVGYSYASNSKISNNTFTASANSAISAAILAEGEGETTFNNEISGNIINDFGTGISANYRDIRIFGNQINNCRTGIQFKNSADMQVYQNTITSTSANSRGFMAHIANVNNVSIYQNEIHTEDDPFYFVQLNRESGQENYTVDIYDNLLTNSSKTTISNSLGVNFTSNISSGGVQIVNSEKINVVDNQISTNVHHGIAVNQVNYDIVLTGNQIDEPAGALDCISIDSSTNPSEVTLDSNSCIQ